MPTWINYTLFILSFNPIETIMYSIKVFDHEKDARAEQEKLIRTTPQVFTKDTLRVDPI